MWAVLLPGWLYTVEMSILKVPMWVIRKARVRLWTTWEEVTSQVFSFTTPRSMTMVTTEKTLLKKQWNKPLSLWLYQRGSVEPPETQTGSSERGEQALSHILLYSTIFYCTVLYSNVLNNSTALYCIILYFIILFCTVLYQTILYYSSTVLYDAVFFCSPLLQCTEVYCAVFYCTTL